jgi:hypothetical protein
MEIHIETIPPPPSIVQRETNIIPYDPTTLVDPYAPTNSVSPRNIQKDITVGHKLPAWDRQNLEDEEKHKSPQGATRERKRPKGL